MNSKKTKPTSPHMITLSMMIVLLLMVFMMYGFGNCGVDSIAGHSKPINALAVTPVDAKNYKERYLISAGLDNHILVWRISTGQVVKNFVGHEAAIHDLYISKDGQYLASASGDETARVWELGDLDDIKIEDVEADIEIDGAYSVMDESLRIVECCAISPDNEYLFTGDDHFDLKVCSLGGSLLRVAKWHTKPVFDIVLKNETSKELEIFTGGEDYQIFRWKLDILLKTQAEKDETTEPYQTLSSHIYDVYTLALSPDEKILASAGKDSTIKIWDADKGVLKRTIKDFLEKPDPDLPQPHNIINSLTFSKDGKYIVSGYQKNVVKAWDVTLDPDWGSGPKAIGIGHMKDVNSVVMVDENTVASGSDDGTIIFWEFEPKKWKMDNIEKNILKVKTKYEPIKKADEE